MTIESLVRLAMESPFKEGILKGKVALLTGGASGIGYEISSKHGASIAIMGRCRHVLDSAVSDLQSLGISVTSSTFVVLYFNICDFMPFHCSL